MCSLLLVEFFFFFLKVNAYKYARQNVQMAMSVYKSPPQKWFSLSDKYTCILLLYEFLKIFRESKKDSIIGVDSVKLNGKINLVQFRGLEPRIRTELDTKASCKERWRRGGSSKIHITFNVFPVITVTAKNFKQNQRKKASHCFWF